MPTDLKPGQSQPSLIWGAAAAAIYVLAMAISGKLGWQHLGLALLAWACVAPAPAARRFVRDWWPMILFWLSYDLMRIFSADLLSRVSVEEPYRWESALFRAPDGSIWPFFFARWTASHVTDSWFRPLALYCNLIYLSQLFAIPGVFMVLWLRRSEHFKALIWSFTALHVMTLVIYYAYPAAPPWWVWENGLTAPTLQRSAPMGLARGSVLAGLFHLSPNRFAAIPSLHGAYPLLLTVMLALGRERWQLTACAAIYTASMWFACVFLNQHYIIDLLIGAALVIPASFAPRLLKSA